MASDWGGEKGSEWKKRSSGRRPALGKKKRSGPAVRRNSNGGPRGASYQTWSPPGHQYCHALTCCSPKKRFDRFCCLASNGVSPEVSQETRRPICLVLDKKLKWGGSGPGAPCPNASTQRRGGNLPGGNVGHHSTCRLGIHTQKTQNEDLTLATTTGQKDSQPRPDASRNCTIRNAAVMGGVDALRREVQGCKKKRAPRDKADITQTTGTPQKGRDKEKGE